MNTFKKYLEIIQEMDKEIDPIENKLIGAKPIEKKIIKGIMQRIETSKLAEQLPKRLKNEDFMMIKQRIDLLENPLTIEEIKAMKTKVDNIQQKYNLK
jgi:hypothetical protein